MKNLIFIVFSLLLFSCESDSSEILKKAQETSNFTLELESTNLIDFVQIQVSKESEIISQKTFEKVSSLTFSSQKGDEIFVNIRDLGQVIYDLHLINSENNQTIFHFTGLSCLIECERTFTLSNIENQ